MESVHPLIIAGGLGTLGKAFARVCEKRSIPYKSLTHSQLDITDFNSIVKAVETYHPSGIINAAGNADIEQAESEKLLSWHVNTYGPILLAAACKESLIPFLTFSTDLVFEGNKQSPYLEDDKTCPLNHYGVTKALAEAEIHKIYPEALIVRTSSFFSPWEDNWVSRALNKLQQEEECLLCERHTFAPSYLPDLVNTSLDLLLQNEKGIWHLTNKGAVTSKGLIEKAAQLLNIDTTLIKSKTVGDLAKKPKYTVLKSQRGIMLPQYEDSLYDFCNQIKLASLINT